MSSSPAAGESITVGDARSAGGRGASFAAQFPAGGLFAIDLSLSLSPDDIVVVVVCGAFASLEGPSGVTTVVVPSREKQIHGRTRLLTKHQQHNTVDQQPILHSSAILLFACHVVSRLHG